MSSELHGKARLRNRCQGLRSATYGIAQLTFQWPSGAFPKPAHSSPAFVDAQLTQSVPFFSRGGVIKW